MTANSKMKVSIWSDVMCPFCYVGKRHLEAALSQFAGAKDVEIEWKSYQLDPSLPKPASELSSYDYLAKRYGITRDESIARHEGVVQMAKEAGLEYHFEKAVVANSFDAHRVIQFAKTKGLGDQAEERFFRAYFTEGRNLCDPKTLIELSKEFGLQESEVRAVVESNRFADEVKRDISEGERIGVRGVPFFVFDNKMAVSGAQPVEVFVKALNQAHASWKKGNPGN